MKKTYKILKNIFFVFAGIGLLDFILQLITNKEFKLIQTTLTFLFN